MSTTDETLLKKRSTQHLHATELIENKASKRKKVSHLDNLNLFLNFLSDINEDQKLIVCKLGFDSLLDISCNCSVDDIFEWLGIQFNTTTSSIELRNGFKFKFTDSAVQKILGIPCGGLPIHTNPSKETVDFISTVVQSSNPTIEHLLSMISENITEEAFSRIFLLLAVSTLVAPNSKGVPSKKFYSALVNLDSIPKYNWCLFALSFLIHQINKMQSDIRNNMTVFPGGCKLILVITHFEFLISSEYKIPTNSFPRLPLWSSTMLKSFIALDTMPGVNLQFGRLAMKHISSTPFSDALNELTVQQPESILHYINSKFPSIHNIQEKTKLESSSQKFWQTILTNSIPTLQTYIDNVHSSLCLSIPSEDINHYTSLKVPAPSNMQLSNAATNSSVPKFLSELQPDINSILSSIDFMDFPMPANYPPSFDSEYSKVFIDSFIQNLSECLNIDNPTNLDLLFSVGLASTKGLPCLEVFNTDPINKINSYIETSPLQVLFDSMKSEPTWKELHATDHLNWRQEKFSFSQCRFISASSSFRGNRLYCAPDEAEIQPPGFKSMPLSPHSCQQTTLKSHQFLLTGSFPSIQETDQKTAPSSSAPSKLEDDIPSFNAITDGLQDVPAHRMTGYQTSTYSLPGSSTLVVNLGSQSYPRFSNHNSPFLYSNSPLRPFNNNSGQPENRFGSPISDPLLVKLLEDYETECKRNDNEAAKQKLFQNFSSATVVHHVKEMQCKQLIFSTPTQSEFYKTMTSVLPHLDSRIFQVDEVWVDQKTLTVSLRPGCWMNPHSLDCYSKILNTDQLIHGRQGLIPNSEVISHIVQREDMDRHMRPLLDHSDPCEARVGFSLQNSNFIKSLLQEQEFIKYIYITWTSNTVLFHSIMKVSLIVVLSLSQVHLPCFNDKQWIVITANLQTGRFFDIMNPDGSGNDKFTTIISIVAFNFKTLFAMTYPNCTAFNIRDFDYRFVPVPRTHFRYDTGVFLLQILKTYRGMGVVGFSTVDLQALREIFLYEIATYSNSEVQLPIVRTFLESHGFRSFK